MKGFYWWNWDAIYTEEDKKNYTPQEKLADVVLKLWFINSIPYSLKDNQRIWIIIPTCSIILLLIFAIVLTILIRRKKKQK